MALMTFLSLVCIFLTGAILSVESMTIDKVLVLVMDQDNPYHSTRSLEFITKLNEQALGSNFHPDIRLLTHRYRKLGAWTLFPILVDLHKSLEPQHDFIFICEEETRIDLQGFLHVLSTYDSTKDEFFGLGLVDQEASVIHHYAFHNKLSEFKYPHSTAGFVLSRPLLEKITKKWLATKHKYDFSIDAYHEFAKFLYDMENRIELTHEPKFCIRKTIGCVTWQNADFPECGDPVSLNKIYFAVKTCRKFHKDRIPLIKSTWTKDARTIEYFSDEEDASIPTVDLGVPNVSRGHCGKTLAILKRALNMSSISADRPWFVLVDDDTLLSVNRMRALLACYDEEDTIAVGERYGYGVRQSEGYDYITLGGGMVLSYQTVLEIVESGFSCKNDDPDDMLLGMSLQHLGIPIIHSPYFHQARPADYAMEYLNSRKAVSFHRFWNNDPKQVYRDYLQDNIHDEL